MSATVRQLILSSWPQRFAPEQLHDGPALGDDGLGLDSVEIAELVLACEERSGRRAGPELFAVDRLTVESLADYFSAGP
jgi:acyl carrier protein